MRYILYINILHKKFRLILDKNVVMGSKRGRFLIRQTRIKKESEVIEHTSPGIEERQTVYTAGLLSVPPPKIERHASEPASSMTQAHHLLTVPSYLVKQHSHPLLPSQSHSPPITTLTLHRQLSHPTVSSMTSSTLTSQLSMDSNLPYVSTSSIKSEEFLVSNKANSPTVVIVSDPLSIPTELPSIRVKTDELHRSISSPQVSSICSYFKFFNFIK